MRLLSAALLLCTTLGCAGQVQLDQASDPVLGNYSLATINGNALPYAHPRAERVQIVAAGLVLQPDNAVGMSVTYQPDKGKQYSRQFNGIYRRQANRLRIDFDDGTRQFASIEVGRLLLDDRGVVYEYKRAVAVVATPF